MFGGGGKEVEGGDVADEGDWYAALVAGEHVGEWLDIIKVRACFVQPLNGFFLILAFLLSGLVVVFWFCFFCPFFALALFHRTSQPRAAKGNARRAV